MPIPQESFFLWGRHPAIGVNISPSFLEVAELQKPSPPARTRRKIKSFETRVGGFCLYSCGFNRQAYLKLTPIVSRLPKNLIKKTFARGLICKLRAHSGHWCQLKMGLAVETAATQTKPAYAGFKTLAFSLVRAGGLRFCSRDFQSLGLKLTLMTAVRPYQMLHLLLLLGMVEEGKGAG